MVESEAESHANELYSRTGRTSCLYAVDLTCSDVVRMLRLTKPRFEFPLAPVCCYNIIIINNNYYVAVAGAAPTTRDQFLNNVIYYVQNRGDF